MITRSLFCFPLTFCAVIVEVDAIVSLVNLYGDRGEDEKPNRLIAARLSDTDPPDSSRLRSTLHHMRVIGFSTNGNAGTVTGRFWPSQSRMTTGR